MTEKIVITNEEIKICPTCHGDRVLLALGEISPCGICKGKGRGTETEFAMNRLELNTKWDKWIKAEA